MSREQLELGVLVAGLGLGTVDYSSDTITLDTRAAELFGVQPDTKIQRSVLHDRIHPEDRPEIDHQLSSLLDPNDVAFIDVKHRIVHEDGTVVWVQARKLVEFEPDGVLGQMRPKSGIVAILDITESKVADARFKLLLGEVNHRAKNLLSIVQSIARMTAKTGDTSTFVERFSDRLASLATNQDLIVSDAWTDVDLETLIKTQLAPFCDGKEKRIELHGPPLRVNADAAQAIGMALHELATNATKYGALSNETGTIEIDWRISSDPEPEFSIRWEEQDGPAVTEPKHKGFGEKVIKEMAARSLLGEVDLTYNPAGVVWHLTAPASSTSLKQSERNF